MRLHPRAGDWFRGRRRQRSASLSLAAGKEVPQRVDPRVAYVGIGREVVVRAETGARVATFVGSPQKVVVQGIHPASQMRIALAVPARLEDTVGIAAFGGAEDAVMGFRVQ